MRSGVSSTSQISVNWASARRTASGSTSWAAEGRQPVRHLPLAPLGRSLRLHLAEGLVADLLETCVERIREEAMEVDRVPFATVPDAAVASGPGFPSPSPTGQLLDHREEGKPLKVQREDVSNHSRVNRFGDGDDLHAMLFE